MIKLLEDYFAGNPCALPPHLRGKLHNDWFVGKFIPRAWTAAGPRCPVQGAGYLAWPPRIVAGKGVSRWENSGATSTLWIWQFDEVVIGPEVYGKEYDAYELNPGNENFGKKIKVSLNDPLEFPARVTDDEDGQHVSPNDYMPSPLQKFTRSGWMRLSPGYSAKWFIYNWKEFPARLSGARGGVPEDGVLFYRSGTRPDPLDAYYNVDKAPFKVYAGLAWN